MPTRRSVSDIKSNLLLRPALTSHFEVEIPKPGGGFDQFLTDNGVFLNQTRLNLMCSEATLPGSNLATLELTNDFHGVTERHAYRRVYDDRIDLTFYVDAQNYMPIRFFETWMKYIVDESISAQSTRGEIDEQGRGTGSLSPNYFYRMRYPDGNNGYTSSGLKVIKFERDYSQILEYTFVKAFPISLTSMPISYDSSSLLKCTVSMTYIRYVLNTGQAGNESTVQNQNGLGPIQQAEFNYNPVFEGQFGTGGVANLSGLSGAAALGSPGTGALSGVTGLTGVSRLSGTTQSTIGGSSQSATKASGNTVSLSTLAQQVNAQGLAQAAVSRAARSVTSRPERTQPPFN